MNQDAATGLTGKLQIVSAASKNRLKRVLGLIGARAILQAFTGISILLLARWIGRAEFGEFSVAWAILVTTSGVLGLGIPIFALRAAVRRDNAATEYALFLNIVSSLVALVVGVIIATIWSPLAIWLVFVLAIPVAIEKNIEVRVGLGTEFGQARLVNAVLVVRGVVLLGLLVVLHFLGLPALIAYAIARIAAVGLTSIVLTAKIRDWQACKIRPTDGSLDILPALALTQAVNWGRQLDVPIVMSAVGALGAGLYAATQKITYPIFLLTGSLNLVVLGPIARGTTNRAKRATAILILSALGVTVVFAIISIWANSLTGLILGEQYRDTGGIALRWLLIAGPALGIVGPLGTILQDKGAAKDVTHITAAATGLTLFGAWIGAHLAGADGAAFSFMVVAWLQVGMLAVASTRVLRDTTSETEFDTKSLATVAVLECDAVIAH